MVTTVDSGGGVSNTQVQAQYNAQAQVAQAPDPAVTARLEETIRFTEHLGDPAYAIGQTLNDPSLSQAQKDEYVARLTELAGEDYSATREGLALNDQSGEKILAAFEDIGTAYTGAATPELRQQVTDAIARGVDSGRISSEDVYNLVDPDVNPLSDGTRQLLTGVTDGAVLNRVSDQLLGDAQRLGYDINQYQTGPQALVAAADIGGMAADHGWTASVNAVALEVDRQMTAGPVAGDMTLTQAMMATTVSGGPYGAPPPGRTGFEALASVVNSTDLSRPGVQDATDNLFRTLVRSGDDNAVGGLDQAGDRARGLNDLGVYFTENVGRMVEDDWRAANTGEGGAHLQVRDFQRNVMFDPQFQMQDLTTTALSDEMSRLAGTIGNEALGDDVRENAASSFGALLGSTQEAARDYVADGRGDADSRIETVRIFSDLVTDKLLDKVPVVGEFGGEFVDAAWEAVAGNVESNAPAYADEATGDLTATAQGFRSAMSDLDAGLLNAFDLRVELYFDPATE